MQESAPQNETPREKTLRIAQKIFAGTATQAEVDEAKNIPQEILLPHPDSSVAQTKKKVPEWMLKEAERRSLGDPKD